MSQSGRISQCAPANPTLKGTGHQAGPLCMYRNKMKKTRLPTTCRWLLLSAALGFQSGCALLFPIEAGEELAHFKDEAPALGYQAPELHARYPDGRQVVLSELVGERPIVLQLGSHSCPVYRYRRFDLFRIQRDYEGLVDFVVVYTTEAHPVGANSPYRDEEWVSGFNRLTRTLVPQPATMEERMDQAVWSTDKLGRDDMIVIDGMDNLTWQTYGSAPSAAFVIDTDGLIVLRQPWVEPRGIRAALDKLLGRN